MWEFCDSVGSMRMERIRYQGCDNIYNVQNLYQGIIQFVSVEFNGIKFRYVYLLTANNLNKKRLCCSQ